MARYLQAMPSPRVALVFAVGATALIGASAPAGAATAKKRHPPTIYRNSNLWATVNVCNPKDHPYTIGVRGSMPGDGQRSETMYMRFQIQYQDPRTKQWVFVAKNADSGYLAVGMAQYSARQSGRSFQIVPAQGQTFVLRGAVSFQWRRGSKVIRSARIHTTAGHRDASGSDPRGYTAATCTM